MALNALNWFEIPVSNMDRALKFYSTILGAEMSTMEAMSGFHMAMFPSEKGVGGALLQGEGYVPSKEGAVIYLNGGEDLQYILDRIPGAGGKIIQQKIQITPDLGYFAVFLDTERNKVAIHSMQ